MSKISKIFGKIWEFYNFGKFVQTPPGTPQKIKMKIEVFTRDSGVFSGGFLAFFKHVKQRLPWDFEKNRDFY